MIVISNRKIKNMRINKNYDSIRDVNIYVDELDEKIEKILHAKENGLLSEEESRILLKFFVEKEMKKDVKHITQHLIRTNKKKRKFMAIFNDTYIEKSYA